MEEKFEDISCKLWGGIIVDREWAKNTLVYKNYINKNK